jgi:CIC family chloride channel protein
MARLAPAKWISRTVSGPDDRLFLMAVGIAAGICAGLAGVALNRAIAFLEHVLEPSRRQAWAFLLPGAGAALAVLFLDKIVRESPGHGVPEVILSVSRRGGAMRLTASFSRLVSSCLTIGFGGSAGPEAPIVTSGAAIGSNIARLFRLNERQRTTALGCGAAAAIGSIFNAPIAGMIFTLEVILGEWSAGSIFPIAVASVAGTEISRYFQGNQIPFNHPPFHVSLSGTLASAGLAFLTAAASLVLTRALRGSHALWERAPVPRWTRAALGGFLVGGVGMLMPQALGEGYRVAREMISGPWSGGMEFLALAALVKILATSLTLGSGGSGGIFAPCLVTGSLLGASFHGLLTLLWPGAVWPQAGCFALLGMAGLISGMLQAPLTALFLIVEITGSYTAVLPLIVVSVGSATLCNLVERSSFYTWDLEKRGLLLRPGTDGRVLADLSPRELLELDCSTAREDMPLREFVELVRRSKRNHFPVEDAEGRFTGIVHIDQARDFLFAPELYDAVMVYQIMEEEPPTVEADASLQDVLSLMDRLRVFSLPVVEDGRFVGMVSKGTILDQYRRELLVRRGV